MQFGTVEIPEDLSYTKKHLWCKRSDNIFTLGWTDYIQSNAGDVNHVELAEKGTVVEVDQDFGSIETSKWVDKLYSPFMGLIVEINDKVIKNPEVINKAPFTEGWLVKIEPRGEIERQHLMSAVEYLEFLKACEE